MPNASDATKRAFLISGSGGTLIQTMFAPLACASSAGCVNNGGATFTTTNTSGFVSSSARNICACLCGSNVVGPVTLTLTLPPRSLAAALAPARISVLHSPAASASTTETVTESLADAGLGELSAAAVTPPNKASCERRSAQFFNPVRCLDCIFPTSLLTLRVSQSADAWQIFMTGSDIRPPTDLGGACREKCNRRTSTCISLRATAAASRFDRERSHQ